MIMIFGYRHKKAKKKPENEIHQLKKNIIIPVVELDIKKPNMSKNLSSFAKHIFVNIYFIYRPCSTKE